MRTISNKKLLLITNFILIKNLKYNFIEKILILYNLSKYFSLEYLINLYYSLLNFEKVEDSNNSIYIIKIFFKTLIYKFRRKSINLYIKFDFFNIKET